MPKIYLHVWEVTGQVEERNLTTGDRIVKFSVLNLIVYII